MYFFYFIIFVIFVRFNYWFRFGLLNIFGIRLFLYIYFFFNYSNVFSNCCYSKVEESICDIFINVIYFFYVYK